MSKKQLVTLAIGVAVLLLCLPALLILLDSAETIPYSDDDVLRASELAQLNTRNIASVSLGAERLAITGRLEDDSWAVIYLERSSGTTTLRQMPGLDWCAISADDQIIYTQDEEGRLIGKAQAGQTLFQSAIKVEHFREARFLPDENSIVMRGDFSNGQERGGFVLLSHDLSSGSIAPLDASDYRLQPSDPEAVWAVGRSSDERPVGDLIWPNNRIVQSSRPPAGAVSGIVGLTEEGVVVHFGDFFRTNNVHVGERRLALADQLWIARQWAIYCDYLVYDSVGSLSVVDLQSGQPYRMKSPSRSDMPIHITPIPGERRVLLIQEDYLWCLDLVNTPALSQLR